MFFMCLKIKTGLLSLLLPITIACTSLPTPEKFADDSSETQNQPIQQKTFHIIAINVEQGDATLVITPSQKIILIDAGTWDHALGILQTLQDFSINKIDYGIATHYDADHIGGFSSVQAGLDEAHGTDDDIVFGKIFDRGGSPLESKTVFDIYAETFDDLREEIMPGMSLSFSDGVTVECLMVNHELADGLVVPVDPSQDDENSRSAALLIGFGQFRYLTTGDLPGGGLKTADLESALGKYVGPVDVLHVGHHGSKTSSNASFLEQITPTAALISVGNDNHYGHPAQEVLERLKDSGTVIYQTEAGNGGKLPESHIIDGNINIVVKNAGAFTVEGQDYP